MMAASVYATPPPDLSGEDTALSDVSNSSQISSTSSQQSKKRNHTSSVLHNDNNTEQIKSLNASPSPSTGSSNYDHDLSKKRRKQTTPIRLSATSKESITATTTELMQQLSNEPEECNKDENESNKNDKITELTNIDNIDINQNTEKEKLLENSSHDLSIKEALMLDKNISLTPPKLAPLNQIEENNSNDNIKEVSSEKLISKDNIQDTEDNLNNALPKDLSETILEMSRKNSEQLLAKIQKNLIKSCEQCNEKFDTDLKLSVHILQVHTSVPKVHVIPKLQTNASLQQHQHQHENDNDNLTTRKCDNDDNENDNDNDSEELGELPMTIKLEEGEYPPSMMHNKMHSDGKSSKSDEWMQSMPGLNFSFPAEAAAALSASNYLSQLPLLGMGHSGPFGGIEGSLSRPPLRIFNPEAYCDMCNKEFCNKYFLKTHKANKHGIYDPNTSSNDNVIPNSSTDFNKLSQLQQVLQLQFQQQQQQQQHQQAQQQIAQQQQQAQQGISQPHPSQTLIPPGEQIVYCDICNKRFTNIFAMKRHRSKMHEIPPPLTSNLVKSDIKTTINSADSSELSSSSLNQSTNEKINAFNIITTSSATSSSSSSSLSISTVGNTTITPITTMSSSSSMLRLPEGFREDCIFEQEDISFTPQPRKLSPSSMQQAREANFSFDKLKRLGVINPEAFCDLCCKEYCNKYFLRTHKLRRHGIFIPADDSKDDELQNKTWSAAIMQQMQQQLQMQQTFQQIQQAAPLNLMMEGGIGNSSEKIEQEVNLNKMVRRSSESDIKEKDNFKRIKLSDPTTFANDPDTSSVTNGGQNDKKNDVLRNVTENFNRNMTENSELNTSKESSDNERISFDLQKLQSMILQLNDLNNQRPIACHLCGKEMENQYMLHAHIATEHSGENNNFSSIGEAALMAAMMIKSSQPPSPTNSNQTEICKQCDKEFQSVIELKQHIIEYHGMLHSPIREGFVTPDRGTGGESLTPTTPSKPLYTITPTSSYCEICNKELCNKYFMKTHMQRMHGIEIENGAQIGGVVCNICNKELCSKYFLRVHKSNSHGIIDDGSPLPQPSPRNIDTPEAATDSIFQALENKQDLTSLSTRYFTHYTEVCPLCSRRFRSAKWLRAHLMSDHGKAGTDKLRELEQYMIFSNHPGKSDSPPMKLPNGNDPNDSNEAIRNLNETTTAAAAAAAGLSKRQFPGIFLKDDLQSPATEVNSQSQPYKEYQCSMCPFTTPYYAFLFIHERSHSIMNNTNESPSDEQINNDDEDEEEIPQNSLKIKTEVSIESETAVSIANDRKTPLIEIPQTSKNINIEDNSTITPSSTPKPQSPKESAGNINVEQNCLEEKKEPNEIEFNPVQQKLVLNSSALTDLVNLTNRPASYAIPKDFDNESNLMQSFLIQEEQTASGNEGNNENEKTINNNFIPAVIYLPVKKRISGPVTVSFTLTPA